MTALDLRPLSLGELLDRTFFLYRRHFLLFVGIAAIPYSIFFVVQLMTALLPIFARSAASGQAQPGRIAAVAAGGGLLRFVAIFVAGLSPFFFPSAPLSSPFPKFTGDIRLPFMRLLADVRGKTGTIFGVLFLERAHHDRRFHCANHSGNLFDCRICVATPAALLEDLGPSDSIRRSFELTKDFAGRAFMIYMLYFAMVWGIIAVFQMPFMFLWL